MKIKSKELLNALKKISIAVNTNKIIPILEYVKIDCKGNTASVTATNLNLTCSCVFSLIEPSEESMLVPFDELEKICSVTSEIEIDKNLKVKFGREYSKLGKPEDTKNFSLPPHFADAVSVDVDGDFFYAMGQALKSTELDSIQPTHNVFLEINRDTLVVFSFGNNTLYVNELKVDGIPGVTAVVPPDFIKATKSMQDAKLEISGKNIKASDDNFTVISSLADCGLLGYKTVFEREKTHNCIINKNDLLSSIQKLEAAKTTHKYHQINLELSKTEITLTSTDELIDRESKSYCPCDNSSELEEIIFNSEVLKSALSQTYSDLINIRFNDYKTPIVITDESVTIFVSPMVKTQTS